MPLRVIFMGTPDFAVPTFLELVGRGYDVAAVYTRAPKPAGRGMELTPSPVEREARRFGIPVHTPKTLRDEEEASRFRAHRADVAVVVAYGLILPKAILEAPTHGCFNVHASLLPRWRGAAPINRAIMAGDADTGVTIMRMDEGLDTGPMAMAQRVPIGADMTAGELHDVLARLGADLIPRALAALEREALVLTPQPSAGVTYAAKIDKAETRIDWARPARQVHDRVRGLSPFPGAWFELAGSPFSSPLRIKVLRTQRAQAEGEPGPPGTVLDHRLTVACGEGAVRILELQRAGRAPMRAAEFLRGTPIAAGLVVARDLERGELEPEFPIEFLVAGTPVSAQTKRSASKIEWQARVKTASRAALPEGHWATGGPIAATLYYFPAAAMQGDIDNIVKPILDALAKHIYVDDTQVERVVVQKFEPDRVFPFTTPSSKLEEALNGPKPLLYVRLSDDPFEELT
jgi:methionyl-tRNA formyltransferase